MNIQFTAGKNLPLTDYLRRHPITHPDESEVNNKTIRQKATEAEEEIVLSQIYGLFVLTDQSEALRKSLNELRHHNESTNQSAANKHANNIEPVTHLKLH